MRTGYRRTAAPIYALAASILLVLALGVYVVLQEIEHRDELAELSLQRQQDTNLFFREVCDRFEIRDEVVITLVRNAYLRALEQGERVYAESLENGLITLETAQGDCRTAIPEIRNPPGSAP